MMENEFVPYEEALLLRDLGFNELCFGRYGTTSKKLFTDRIFKNSEELCEDGITFTNDLFAAPLWQQAFDWLLSEHNLWFKPEYPFEDTIKYTGVNHVIGTYGSLADVGDHNSNAEARLGALRKMIEIVKEK